VGHSSSSRVIAAAWTCTSASPARGRGVSIRSQTSFSGPPGGCRRIALIVGGISGVCWASVVTVCALHLAHNPRPLQHGRSAG
jgi:hypothetical protein